MTRVEERLWTARTWPFIVSALGLMTVIALESFAITTVLPVVVADLDARQWYSLSYAATITTGLVGMIVGGPWADRRGTRAPLVVGGSLFVLGIALCALAPNGAVFVVGRLLQGVGGGVDGVVLYVLIARHVPEGARPRMFGMLTAAWLLPSLGGPLVAGLLAENVGWRAVFGMLLCGAVGSLAGLLRVTRADEPADEPAVDAGAAGGRAAAFARAWLPPAVGRPGALAVLAAALLVALHVGSQLPVPGSMLVVVPAVVALAVTAGAIFPPGTLRLRGTPQRMVALRAALGSAVAATEVNLALHLQAERGFTPTTAGLVIAVSAAGWSAGAWVQGRFGSGPDTHRRLLVAAVPLVAAGPVGFLLYAAGAAPLGVVVVAEIAMGAGMGVAYSRVPAVTLSAVDASEHGRWSSALQAGESMASTAVLAATAALIR